MSQTPRQFVRPVFVLVMCVAFGLIIMLNMLPALGGSGRAKLPRVFNNLKQIEIAKQMWASDHAATNGTAVSESDLVVYLRPRQGSTGLVVQVDSEIYRVNAVGAPAEARLERPFGARFPAGTLVRRSTNANFEILLPTQQEGTNGWQPFSRTVAPRSSP